MARSLHFLGLVAGVAFTDVHTAMVIVTGLGMYLSDIVLSSHGGNHSLGIFLGCGVIVAIVALYALLAGLSLRHKRSGQRVLAAFYRPSVRLLALRVNSKQRYKPSDITPCFTLNGDPPDSEEYLSLLWQEFSDYELVVTGLVEHPLLLSMNKLLAMAVQSHITKHNCIQEWTAIGQWAGVPMSAILNRCIPLANARYVVFCSYSKDTSGEQFYETIPIEVAGLEQTILAYEMNGHRLPMPHGANLRVRCETMLGFKMCKWICRIELVEDYRSVRGGQGGSREDNRYNEVYEGI